MEINYTEKIAKELSLKISQVASTIKLLDEGSTIPFITRYRKEATENLDEIAVTKIRDRLTQLKDLDKRREAILASIKEQKKLTPELEKKILAAQTMSVLEDLYLPYKPKRRTRATIAKEKGLEPLAKMIFAQNGIDPQKEAEKFIDKKKKVETVEQALAGARDIIAEWINENANARAKLRNLFEEKGVMYSHVIKGKEEEGIKYKDYFNWQEPVVKVPSHRILAVRRGEKEKMLSHKIYPPEQGAIDILDELFVKGDKEDSVQVRAALEDSYKRLLSLSLETEIRLELKKKADKAAIEIFSNNLRNLLMASPLGQKDIMAIDPGYRTGCKVVCLDKQGKFLHNDTIYIVDSEEKLQRSKKIIKDLCEKFNIEVIAIGNGTASRETESFIRSLGLSKDINVILVNESGASIYSASEAAREEFPDLDATVRGSVSIGRRLMDPLAELVKIDPKSIGVGQYQYDVDQKLLKEGLSDVVVSCVNLVGVEVNTASKELLTYVSGLGPTLARAIVDHRNQKGPFSARSEFMDVPGIGEKAFVQCAGFLRILNGKNILDSSAVHPESYDIAEKIAKDLDCGIKDLIENESLRKKIDLPKYVTERVGMPTLLDIKAELAKPGRDPREPFQLFEYKEGIEKIEDLEAGMELTGVVTNVTAFGAFVDIGVHQDGLVHISQLSDRYVKDPNDVVKVHQKIKVKVLEVDLDRKRIALSAKQSSK